MRAVRRVYDCCEGIGCEFGDGDAASADARPSRAAGLEFLPAASAVGVSLEHATVPAGADVIRFRDKRLVPGPGPDFRSLSTFSATRVLVFPQSGSKLRATREVCFGIRCGPFAQTTQTPIALVVV